MTPQILEDSHAKPVWVAIADHMNKVEVTYPDFRTSTWKNLHDIHCDILWKWKLDFEELNYEEYDS